MQQYDVVVIGAGPAGGGIAVSLAQAGKQVAMIEADGVGGVCPLRGCNPKKVLMSGSEAVETARHLEGKGITGRPVINWPELDAFKRSFVAPVSSRAEKSYQSYGINIIHGRAEFTGPNSVQVNEQLLKAETICICTGYVPNIPKIPGIGHTITSDDFLTMHTLPRHMVFMGGGFIAFEFAHMVARAGARATVLVRSNRALRGFDGILVDKLIEASFEAGIDVRLNTPVESFEKHEDGISVNTRKITFEADAVINCSGRVPALEGLGLDKAGIKAAKDGIPVNEHMQCLTAPHIYAVGDVASTPYALTPTASYEADIAARNILEPGSATINLRGVPSVVFTLPPLARIGLTQEQADMEKIPYKIVENELVDWFPWQRLGEKHGGCRILVDENGQKVLGAHILGHHAEELANTFALIIRHGIPLEKLRDTLWTYPTSGYYIKYMF